MGRIRKISDCKFVGTRLSVTKFQWGGFDIAVIVAYSLCNDNNLNTFSGEKRGSSLRMKIQKGNCM